MQKGKGCLRRGGSTRPSSPRPLDTLSRSSSRHRCLTCLSRMWSSSSLDDCPQVITHTRTQHWQKKNSESDSTVELKDLLLVEKNKKSLITWHNKQCSCSTLASHLSWCSLSGRFVSHTTLLDSRETNSKLTAPRYHSQLNCDAPVLVCVCVLNWLIFLSSVPQEYFRRRFLNTKRRRKGKRQRNTSSQGLWVYIKVCIGQDVNVVYFMSCVSLVLNMCVAICVNYCMAILLLLCETLADWQTSVPRVGPQPVAKVSHWRAGKSFQIKTSFISLRTCSLLIFRWLVASYLCWFLFTSLSKFLFILSDYHSVYLFVTDT